MRKFIAFLVMLAFTAILLVVGFSWGYSGTLSGDGVALATGHLFGGLGSLSGSLLGIVLLVVMYFVVFGLADSNKNVAAGIVAVIGVIIAGFIINRVMSMPSGQISAFFVLLVVAAVMTFVMARLLGRRPSSSSATTTTTASTSTRGTLVDKAKAWWRTRNLRSANNQTTATTHTTP